jgi:Natural resistance-associated macrophage protein
MRELGPADTVGILRQPGVRTRHSSSGLGWEQLYLSAQQEQPYSDLFDPAPTHLLILHLDGPVTVRRGKGGGARTRTVPAGGLFLQPAGRALAVELGGPLDTVHACLTDEALCDATDGRPVELCEELGATDPLRGRRPRACSAPGSGGRPARCLRHPVQLPRGGGELPDPGGSRPGVPSRWPARAGTVRRSNAAPGVAQGAVPVPRCAAGIVGATVMPHAIYLHSALTQELLPREDTARRKLAVRMSMVDVVVALGVAAVVNAAILMAATPLRGAGVDSLTDAHTAFGTAYASLTAAVFGIGLLAEPAGRRWPNSAPPTAAEDAERHLVPPSSSDRLTV